MPRTRTAALLALATTGALATGVLLQPSGSTQAAWNRTLPAPTVKATAGGVPLALQGIDRPVTTPTNNSPVIRATNQSQRHTALTWIESVTPTLLRPLNNSGDRTLTSKVELHYGYGTTADGLCETAVRDVWTVTPAGTALFDATTYPRGSVNTSVQTPPGVTQTLCPLVRPNYDTATGAGRKQMLMEQAGRAIDFTTGVRQTSLAPATWDSGVKTVTTRYRVAFPPAGLDPKAPLCSNYALTPRRGDIYWSWPDTSTTNDAGSTPAIAQQVLMREDPVTKQWVEGTGWGYPGTNWRRFTSLNSDYINNNDGNSSAGGAPVRLKLRMYPYKDASGAVVKSSWVDSTWILTVREVNDSFQCGAVESNPGPLSQGLD